MGVNTASSLCSWGCADALLFVPSELHSVQFLHRGGLDQVLKIPPVVKSSHIADSLEVLLSACSFSVLATPYVSHPFSSKNT